MDSNQMLDPVTSVARRCIAILALVAALSTWGSGECASVGPVNLHGNLDLVAVSRNDQDDINSLNRGENPFNTLRVRLFAE